MDGKLSQLLSEDVGRVWLQEWRRWGISSDEQDDLRQQVLLSLLSKSDDQLFARLSIPLVRRKWLRTALRYKTIELLKGRSRHSEHTVADFPDRADSDSGAMVMSDVLSDLRLRVDALASAHLRDCAEIALHVAFGDASLNAIAAERGLQCSSAAKYLQKGMRVLATEIERLLFAD